MFLITKISDGTDGISVNLPGYSGSIVGCVIRNTGAPLQVNAGSIEIRQTLITNNYGGVTLNANTTMISSTISDNSVGIISRGQLILFDSNVSIKFVS